MPGNGGWSVAFFGSGTNGAVQAIDPPGYQIPDRARNNLILLGSLFRPCPITCGSRQDVYFPAVADTYEDHPDYLDTLRVNWDALKGDIGDTFTVSAFVDVKCENAATTITPRIVEAGTSTANVTGSAHASTSWGTQTLNLVSSTGTKTYRLQIKRSDLVFGVQCVAHWVIFV